jgi:hypothetical protein
MSDYHFENISFHASILHIISPASYQRFTSSFHRLRYTPLLKPAEGRRAADFRHAASRRRHFGCRYFASYEDE